MQLKILGSSSKGNSYLLESETEILIIEAGVKLSEVKKAIDFNISKVVGCIVSHQHNDHAGNIIDYIQNGILCLALPEVFASKYIFENNAYAKWIKPLHGYKVGNFNFLTFPVTHDVPCLGFVVDHPESGKILFITDTMTCDYKFNDISHMLIECNYSDEILNRNIQSGKIPASMRLRLLSTHMELETTKQIIQNQDISKLNNIVLIHLSDGNSNEKQFINEIEELTGKPVFAAKAGMELTIGKEPF